MSRLERMQGILASSVAGDVVLVRDTGSDRTTRYAVTCVTGEVAPVVELVGTRGARRALIDGGHVIWIRRETRDGPAFRRVTGIECYPTEESQASDGGKQDANAPDAVEDPPGVEPAPASEPSRSSITPMCLARLIACSSAEDLAGWVIDRLVTSEDPAASETLRALQVYLASRDRLPELRKGGGK